MACIRFTAQALLTVLIINFRLTETYLVNREIVYVKEVRDVDTATEYPNEVFLTLHKDASSGSFFELLLEKYLEDLDVSSSEHLHGGIGRSGHTKRQHIYKVNDGQFFITLKRLPERSFHVQGHFCMDGKVVIIEPVNEDSVLDPKHYFSLRNFVSPVCDIAGNYQRHDFKEEEEEEEEDEEEYEEEEDESSIPAKFKLSNAFGTFAGKNIFNDRVKREVEQLTIELLMVIDYAAYSWWGTLVGKLDNADSEIMALIRQYYAYVFQGIDTRFGSIDKYPFVIDLAFAGLFVAKTEHESYWTTTSIIDGDGDSTRIMVNSSEALEKFQKWLDEADFLPKYDHAILFTGTNLTYAGSPGNTGLAFASSMCRNISNSSIVEDIFDFRTITYATQQVARALGTRDDMDNNDCLEFFNYIMAPKFKLPINSFASNKWKFSTCSQQYITDYNIELNEDNLTCLKEKSHSEKYSVELLSLVEKLPGVSYSGKVQCENAFGLQSDVCRMEIGTSYSKICSGLLCTYPGSDKCDFIFPADGTPCGNKKYCWQGSCLGHEDALESSDTCVFGNDESMNCYRLVVSEPSQCYLEDIRYKCCKTCELFYTGITGCEYGDRSDDCSLRGCVDGDQDYASKTCCLTCLDGPTPFARPILSTTTESATGHSTTLQTLASSSSSAAAAASSSTAASPFLDSPSMSPPTSLSYNSFAMPSFMTATPSSSPLVSLKSSPVSTSLPLFSSSYLTLARKTSQQHGATVTGHEKDSTSSMSPLEQEATTSYIFPDNAPHGTKDAFTLLSQDSSTTSQTKIVDVSNEPKVEGKTDVFTTYTPLSATETTRRSITDVVTPAVSSKHVSAHERNTEETTGSKFDGTKTKDHTLVAKTTKSSVLKDSNKSTTDALCSCPVSAAHTTRPSPTKHLAARPSVATDCVSAVDKALNQSFSNKMFFKDVARTMQDNQRHINNGVYQNIRSLYMAVSRHLKGFQREYENENESWHEGSETPSNDDDDVNRKLKPIWKKHYKDLIRDLKRDVREMRYRVLALINRHLKYQMYRSI